MTYRCSWCGYRTQHIEEILIHVTEDHPNFDRHPISGDGLAEP